MPPTPDELEHEAHFVTTAPTLKLLNHHPLLEDFLHEALLKKDYLQQIPFLAAGLVGPGPVLPEADLAVASTNNMANQNGRPGPSDITTAPTTPPMTAATTARPTALLREKAEGRDLERPSEMVKPAVGADLLTTAMGHLGPWAKPGQATPETNSQSEHTGPHVAPTLAFFQGGLPDSDTPTTIAPTARPEVSTPSMVSTEDEETATTTITTTTVITSVPATGERSEWGVVLELMA